MKASASKSATSPSRKTLVATLERHRNIITKTTMTTKKTLILLNIAGLIGTLIWLMTSPSWEPLVAVIGLIGALITQLKLNSKKKETLNMTQKGGKNSTNYQAGGDINITK